MNVFATWQDLPESDMVQISLGVPGTLATRGTRQHARAKKSARGRALRAGFARDVCSTKTFQRRQVSSRGPSEISSQEERTGQACGAEWCKGPADWSRVLES